LAEYAVQMKPSPTITDEEARRRLSQVYALLLNLGNKEAADSGDPAANLDPSADGAYDTPKEVYNNA